MRSTRNGSSSGGRELTSWGATQAVEASARARIERRRPKRAPDGMGFMCGRSLESGRTEDRMLSEMTGSLGGLLVPRLGGQRSRTAGGRPAPGTRGRPS